MQNCPKCGNKMERGFVVDNTGQGSTTKPEWIEGAPEVSFWTGVKLKGRVRYDVDTYRCSKCGFLEAYAQG